MDVERTPTSEFRGPYTNDEVAERLHGNSPVGAINAVWQGKQKLFVPDLVRIALAQKDMWVINRASKALKDIAGVDFYPWELAPLQRWWDKNSTSYTNWPYAEYMQADGHFQGARYQQALQAYDAVLAFDPGAEKSRAIAVACAVELGMAERADSLLSGFGKKTSRWGEWATCTMMLTTGEVAQATHAFANLAKKYPTFAGRAWIREGTHVLRRIDWSMYEQLMAEEKGPSKAIHSANK